MSEITSIPNCRRYIFAISSVAIFAIAYPSFVGSSGPVRSASSGIGWGASRG